MKSLFTSFLFSILWCLSLLPMRLLYLISDALYFLVYYIVRYRKMLVRKQLKESFPEKEVAELRKIERDFYHFFCDLLVEYVKLITISPNEMKRRVQFPGLQKAIGQTEQEGSNFCFFFLGHYGNWEWLASYALWVKKPWQASQIYHPLRNQTMDSFLLKLRSQFGGQCIPMKETLRHILANHKAGKKELMAFIADQSPKWEAMHHWTTFLHHDTSFFVGAERIGKQVNASMYYVRVQRPRRGYYIGEVIPITINAKQSSNYEVTNSYAQLLEEQIRQTPHLWLWSHNRWKRTREEWERRFNT